MKATCDTFLGSGRTGDDKGKLACILDYFHNIVHLATNEFMCYFTMQTYVCVYSFQVSKIRQWSNISIHVLSHRICQAINRYTERNLEISTFRTAKSYSNSLKKNTIPYNKVDCSDSSCFIFDTNQDMGQLFLFASSHRSNPGNVKPKINNVAFFILSNIRTFIWYLSDRTTEKAE